MKYDPQIKLFIGLPDKEKHFDMLQEYYGRMKKTTLSWSLINTMVDGMFTNQYGDLGRKKLDFFGNDGVCLFKYFVKPDDPQRHFVWGILALNFICFTMITISYIFINFISTKSSSELTQGPGNKMIKNRNIKMQRKISFIIATDFFCWVPFVIVCCLHSLEVLDATSWYALFSIIILPINSVINPLLYDNKITTFISRSTSRFYSFIMAIITSPVPATTLPDVNILNNPCSSNEALELEVMNSRKNTVFVEDGQQPCSSMINQKTLLV